MAQEAQEGNAKQWNPSTNMAAILRDLKEELQTLKEENRDLKYQLVLMHADPSGCRSVEEQRDINQACEEIKRLNKQLFDARQALESSEVHSRELKEENTLLRSRLVGLREQAAQLKRIWEEQSGELSRLRHHQTHRSTHVKQHTLASPQLATLERMGPTVKQARQRPRRSFSMGNELTSFSAPTLRDSSDHLPYLPPLNNHQHHRSKHASPRRSHGL